MSLKGLVLVFTTLLWGGTLFLTWTAPAVFATEPFTWLTLETKHCVIRYQRIGDLKAFNEKMDYSPGNAPLTWLKRLLSGTESAGLEEKLAQKVDLLFERVQEILDMRKRMKTVYINLYGNERELQTVCHVLFKRKCDERSWYLYEFQTIYCNVSDVHVGMVAHEMAHHIVDHYLIVRPPRATAEILARYVDQHLHEEIRQY